MAKQKITIEFSRAKASYDIDIGSGQLSGVGKWARRALGKSVAKVVIVSNPTVFKLYGQPVADDLASAGFEVFVSLMKDGEQYKNLASVEKTLAFFAASGISRTDAVLALGGGVVGDLAGFASAIHLRGIAFLQVPTTLLSMIDSSVGGKTGVNSGSGKNTIGAFHQPRGVLIDTETLSTLPPREITAGLCEAIKQGAIGSRKLFDATAALIERHSPAGFSLISSDREFAERMNALIADQVKFKADIVAGDQLESTSRRDSRSRKILNFGHTLAHALEKITDFKNLKHGEAVGYGILYAAELSKMLALIDPDNVKLLNDVVHRLGTLPPLNNLDPQEVFEAFRFDKKVVAGSLQMILLKGIGRPVIVNGDEIPRSTHIKVLKKLLAG